MPVFVVVVFFLSLMMRILCWLDVELKSSFVKNFFECVLVLLREDGDD